MKQTIPHLQFVTRVLAAVSGIFLAAPASAQQAASTVKASASPELFSASYLFQVVGSLLLVFVCLFVVVYFLKRFHGVGAGSSA
ncbi:MAG: hypothetical protein NWQ45_10290, partial [Congregibacter sp.]|nr:hypothetical protein [Congregibacter sp.]